MKGLNKIYMDCFFRIKGSTLFKNHEKNFKNNFAQIIFAKRLKNSQFVNSKGNPKIKLTREIHHY